MTSFVVPLQFDAGVWIIDKKYCNSRPAKYCRFDRICKKKRSGFDRICEENRSGFDRICKEKRSGFDRICKEKRSGFERICMEKRSGFDRICKEKRSGFMQYQKFPENRPIILPLRACGVKKAEGPLSLHSVYGSVRTIWGCWWTRCPGGWLPWSRMPET